MDTIGYNKIKVSGDIKLEKLLNFNIDLRLNEHGKALIVGEVSKDTAEDISKNNYKNKEIIIKEMDDDGEEKLIPIFSGLISNIRIEINGGFYKASIEATTGTYLLDMKKTNRSFQNVNSTYEDIIKEVVDGNENSDVICYKGEDRKIGTPIIQYMETDWEFIKRLASHLNTVLIPEHTFSRPRLMVGMTNSNEAHCILENDFVAGLDQTYYELVGSNLGLEREDFIFYTVKSGENMPIGNKIMFRNNSYTIYEKNIKLEQSEVIHTYKIGNKGLGSRNKYYNTKISGMSLLGTVLKAEGETIKLNLDIDETQEESTAYSYTWTPPTGNMMYCMPKVGTRVSLYMSDDNEQNAKAVNCIRTNGSTCKNTSDTSKRALTTEHGKQLNLYPDTMGFASNASESGDVDSAPLKLLLDDNKGIVLQSKNNIGIYALESIEFKAPSISYTAGGELILLQVGSEVTEASLESPKTCISLSNYKDLYAELSKLEGYSPPKTYDPFPDAPQEGTFDWGGLVGNILAGLAVVAVAAVVIASGGVALGIIAASAYTSTVVAAAVCGAVTVGFVAYGDVKSGNVSSTNLYIYKAISGTVTGAFCGALGPGPGALLKEYLVKSLVSGMAGGAAGTVTDFAENWIGLKLGGKQEYSVGFADLANNIIFGGVGGIIAGGISYKFFGAGGSDLAKRLAASNSKAPSFIRSVANQNGVYTNKDILRFIGPLYRFNAEDAVKISINKFAQMVVKDPMPLLSKCFKETRNLIVKNGIRESAISGIGGTDLSNYYQGTEVGKTINDKFNSYNNNKVAGSIEGKSKEDMLREDFFSGLNSKISEIGNEISNRLENDIPQYAGGW